MGILRRAARATLTRRREEEGEVGQRQGGPFELLMREELPRLLSINFSNYVAEDVPPEENRLPPSSALSISPSLNLVRLPYRSYFHPHYP